MLKRDNGREKTDFCLEMNIKRIQEEKLRDFFLKFLSARSRQILRKSQLNICTRGFVPVKFSYESNQFCQGYGPELEPWLQETNRMELSRVILVSREIMGNLHKTSLLHAVKFEGQMYSWMMRN